MGSICKHGITEVDCKLCHTENSWPAPSLSPASPAERPEQTLTIPQMMHDDAVTKIELWKRNQELRNNYEALKLSHAALLEIVKYLRGYLCTHPDYQRGFMEAEQIMNDADRALANAKALEGL